MAQRDERAGKETDNQMVMHVRSQAAPHAPGQAGGLVNSGRMGGGVAQRGDREREERRTGGGKRMQVSLYHHHAHHGSMCTDS